jgi:hypothetical protein
VTDLVEKIERVTPLEFLEEVYSCNELPLTTRMRAATAAAPYVHPKLQAIAHFDGGGLAERMERAGRMRSARAIARGEKTLKQCSGPYTPTEEELELARQSPEEPKPVFDNSPLGKRLALAHQRLEGLEKARAEGRLDEFIRGPKVIEGKAEEAEPRRF